MSSLESIYEINIQEQNSFSSKTSSSLFNEERLAKAKVFPVALEKNSPESSIFSSEGLTVFANPFIESYYPVLNESSSEKASNHTDSSFISLADDYFSEKDNLDAKHREFGTKEFLTFKEFDEENECFFGEEKTEKAEEKEQSPEKCLPSDDTPNKRNLKRQIIEAYSSIFQKINNNKWKNLMAGEFAEKEAWHLHHHEHHHYYHLNSSASESGNCDSQFLNITGNESSSPDSIIFRNVKTPKNPNKIYLKSNAIKIDKNVENSRFENNPKASNGLSVVNQMILPGNVPGESGGYCFASSRKISGSIDSLNFSKKSDLLTIHTYSDTNISRHDSGQTSDETLSKPSSFVVFEPRIENSLSKISEWLTDTNIMTEIPCRKCSSKSSENSGTDVDNSTRLKRNQKKCVKSSREKMLGPKPKGRNESRSIRRSCHSRNESKTYSYGSSEKNYFQSKNTGDKFHRSKITRMNPGEADLEGPGFFETISTGTSQFIDEKIESALEKSSIKVWTEKFKCELDEIKNQLQRIEERHSKKKEKLSSNVTRGKTPTTNDFFGAEITVYSSKTYIVGPNSLTPGNEETWPRGKNACGKNLFANRRPLTSNQKETYHLFYAASIEPSAENQITSDRVVNSPEHEYLIPNQKEVSSISSRSCHDRD